MLASPSSSEAVRNYKLTASSLKYIVCADAPPDNCDIGVVSVTVKEAEGNTICTDDSSITSFETASTIEVLDNDKVLAGEFDLSSLVIVAKPEHGEAKIVSHDAVRGWITYTPNEAFAGIDSFRYHGNSPPPLAHQTPPPTKSRSQITPTSLLTMFFYVMLVCSTQARDTSRRRECDNATVTIKVLPKVIPGLECGSKVWLSQGSAVRVFNERESPLRPRTLAQTGEHEYGALAYNGVDGYLYAVTLPSNAFGQRPAVLRIDGEGNAVASAILSEAGEGWSFLAADIDNSGNLYLLRLGSDIMYTVSDEHLASMAGFKGTLPFSQIFPVSGMGLLSQLLDVAFHPTQPNFLYAFDNHLARVVRLDVFAHSLIPIGPTFLTLRTIHSVFFDAVGNLYAIQDNGHLWLVPLSPSESLSVLGGTLLSVIPQ